MSAVVRHVVASIGPASVVQGDAARRRVAAAGAPILDCLARALGGAQHSDRPRAERRVIAVVAADHGCGDPGVALGVDHPTVVAARAIADGDAALPRVARSTQTPIVVIDAGTREPDHMPASTIRLGRGPTLDLMAGPAMTVVDATLGLEAGIALAVSLAEPRLGVLAVGALGLGAEVASAAILGARTGAAPGLGDALAEQAAARGAAARQLSPLEQLAAFGGAETAVLAGAMLAAASMNIPVVLDGYATGAAAAIAAALAPDVTGYLIAAHAGTFTQPMLLAHLGLEPVLEVGLGHGEGTGAAMLLPWLEQVAMLAGTTER
jgi:nicotinate-nucleotide--dimethylbenzimidazole phosphoribosyltransferase